MAKKLWDRKLWKSKPNKSNYPAAYDYLELLLEPDDCKRVVKRLRRAKMSQKKAKDILRSSRLPLLPKDNIHVRENIKKSKMGEKLSPVLLVSRKGKLIIADGYHRVCSVYFLSEDYVIPCKLIHI